MPQKTTWNLKTNYYNQAIEISEKCGISIVLAQLLINRGIDNSEAVTAFLNPTLNELHSPWLLPDMDKAVNIIIEAINKQKSVLIYGDYDADGVTATALLYDLLVHWGVTVNYYIPDRFEDGYGLTRNGISTALQKFEDTELFITVDCGISSIEEIAELMERNLEVIVTDHHEQLAELPPAQAVVNPKTNSSQYPFSQLAGVGVALKLGQAVEESLLEEEFDQDKLLTRYLDLVTVGTVADLVPLIDENRCLVAHGLNKISQNRVGLQSLVKVLGLSPEKITAGQVGFLLAPRINAAGRLASAEEAVDLLVTTDKEKADKLAAELDRDNRERQQLEQEITKEAEEYIEKYNLIEKGPVLVVWNDNWHEGVIGIVASRILEKYHRPVVVLTKDKDPNLVKGSCRSISGFHIAKALNSCQDLLVKYGGHELAAGLSLQRDKITELAERLNQLAQEQLTSKDLIPSVDVDLLLPAESLCSEVVEEIELLEPFGIGNPRPVMGCSNIQLASVRAVGKEKNHLQLQFKGENNFNLNAIWFQGVQHKSFNKLKTGEYANIAFTPKISTYNSKSVKNGKKFDLQIKDMQLSDSPSGTVYDYRQNNKRSTVDAIIDQRQNQIVLVNNNHRKEKIDDLYPETDVYRVSDGDEIVRSSHEDQQVDIIFFDLPYDVQLVRKWVKWANPENIYLLYNEQDKQINDHMWKTAIPDEELLDLCWRILSEGKVGKDFTLKELKGKLEQNSSYAVTNRLVEKCLQILKDLELIITKNSSYCIIDSKKVDNLHIEVDVQLSPTFIAEQNKYSELQKWEKLFLQGSSSALSLLLFHQEIPVELIRSYLM